MPKATCLTAVCGQEVGVLGDDATAGREPGGLDAGNELTEQVRQ